MVFAVLKSEVIHAFSGRCNIVTHAHFSYRYRSLKLYQQLIYFDNQTIAPHLPRLCIFNCPDKEYYDANRMVIWE